MREYLSWDYASASRLSRLARSPAHLRAYLDEPSKDTAALKAGRAIHAAVLEPHLFETAYRAASQCVATTSKGAQCSRDGSWPVRGGAGSVCTQHAASFEVAPDVLTISLADHATCVGIRTAIANHPTASGFFRLTGESELSVVWDDPETGVRCKGRWDRYVPELLDGTIMDVKTTRDARPHPFTREIVKYGYARQAALYLMGAKALGLPCEGYALLGVEKEPPFGLALYRITEATFGVIPEPGDVAFHMVRHVQALLRRYDACTTSGEYPGYPPEVTDVTLPSWAWSDLDRTTNQIEEDIAA